MAMTMRVQRQAGLARAQPAKVRVSRRRCVVVDAAKKSVGDLSEADLKGKAVFVRAGEQRWGCNSCWVLLTVVADNISEQFSACQRPIGLLGVRLAVVWIALPWGLLLVVANCWLHAC
jgi:hypothetical protein